MLRLRGCALLLLVGLAGCGGSGSGLEDYELSSLRADAASAASAAALDCAEAINGKLASDDPAAAAEEDPRFAKHVDAAIEAYKTSERDADVRDSVVSVMETLRSCDQTRQAERLERILDEE